MNASARGSKKQDLVKNIPSKHITYIFSSPGASREGSLGFRVALHPVKPVPRSLVVPCPPCLRWSSYVAIPSSTGGGRWRAVTWRPHPSMRGGARWLCQCSCSCSTWAWSLKLKSSVGPWWWYSPNVEMCQMQKGGTVPFWEGRETGFPVVSSNAESRKSSA